ncbi:Hypothetical predicted protein [Octopus vulgaris]|uniref:Uncharacterized protein n=1 Tax=Octopus vulgaris TaxID=6645 RepID=A0AA36FR07_OCTVU|nr:Hypothetical predicted protein [Octopus vulgaris]
MAGNYLLVDAGQIRAGPGADNFCIYNNNDNNNESSSSASKADAAHLKQVIYDKSNLTHVTPKFLVPIISVHQSRCKPGTVTCDEAVLRAEVRGDSTIEVDIPKFRWSV